MRHRILWIGTVLIFAAVVVAIAAIQIQQQALRIRAERLLLDVRNLELRKSTWPDAQRLFARWGYWGHYDGLCISSDCDYQIELKDFFYRHPGLVPYAPWVRRAYAFLGIRMSLVRANVLVRNGLVWGKGFSLRVEVPPEGGRNPPFAGYGYRLIGESESVSNFAPAGFWPQLAMHPEYTVTTPGGCTGCLAVFARFTPFADSSDVARLMDFNLSCLTSRKPCREKEDIMPSAWRQYTSEKGTLNLSNDPSRCVHTLQAQGRDTDNAVIVDVLSNRTEPGIESFQVSTVRLADKLKAASFWEVGTTREVRVFPGTVSLTQSNLPADVSLGGHFIMFFQHSHNAGLNGPEIWLDQCGAIPLTDVNLEAVRTGIEHDFKPRPPE